MNALDLSNASLAAPAPSEAARTSRIFVIFRNDDPSALSDVEHERRVAAIFERYRVPQVLGVIPNCCAEGFREIRGTKNVPLADNPAMVRFLRDYAARSGSEIALHGFTHRTNPLSNPARREFFEFRGVGLEQQTAWIRQGTEMIEQALGVRPLTFVPPWNRLDADTLEACARAGYRIVSAGDYTMTHPGLVSIGTDCAVADFPRRIAIARDAQQPVLIRVLYHSRTTRSESELGELEVAVRLAAEEAGCEVVTLSQAAERHAELARAANAAARAIVDPTELWGTQQAKAVFHQRLLLRPFNGVRNRMQRSARDMIERGGYAQSQTLGAILERMGKLDLRAGRLSLGAIGLIVGNMCLFFGDFAGITIQAMTLGSIGLLAILCGLGASRWATAPDTRREARVAILCFMLGFALPAGLTILRTLGIGPRT
jgi:peptidoglycan/xylan/chitin deacetylase (PgdA/CDA1 family)